MFSRPALALLLVVLCLAAPLAVGAGVYKWVDEQGVVNYGDTPPQQGRGVRPLDSSAGTLSVVPGMPREELERLRERDDDRRIRQLEAEVEELRAREAAQAAAPVAQPSDPGFTGYPVYRRPVYGYARNWHRRAGAEWADRPKHPVAKPWPSGRAPRPHSGGRAPLLGELPFVAVKR